MATKEIMFTFLSCLQGVQQHVIFLKVQCVIFWSMFHKYDISFGKETKT